MMRNSSGMSFLATCAVVTGTGPPPPRPPGPRPAPPGPPAPPGCLWSAPRPAPPAGASASPLEQADATRVVVNSTPSNRPCLRFIMESLTHLIRANPAYVTQTEAPQLDLTRRPSALDRGQRIHQLQPRNQTRCRSPRRRD